MRMPGITYLLLFTAFFFTWGHGQLQVNSNANTLHYIAASMADADTIYWKAGHKLERNDFKAVPNSMKYAGESSIGIKLHYADTDSGYTVNVKTFFVKSHSWIKEDSTGYILNHEQGHFNLEEIYTRKLRRSLALRNYAKIPGAKFSKKMNENINELYLKINKEAKERQIQYDAETNHSAIEPMQSKWDTKIKDELELLKEYEE